MIPPSSSDGPLNRPLHQPEVMRARYSPMIPRAKSCAPEKIVMMDARNGSRHTPAAGGSGRLRRRARRGLPARTEDDQSPTARAPPRSLLLCPRHGKPSPPEAVPGSPAICAPRAGLRPSDVDVDEETPVDRDEGTAGAANRPHPARGCPRRATQFALRAPIDPAISEIDEHLREPSPEGEAFIAGGP